MGSIAGVACGYRARTMISTLRADTLLGGRYRLVERIAAGGQGEVWRAEDTTLGRPAAVKVLRTEYADDAEFRERFRREAQHAAGLSHPGIAQVFDYNEGDDGTPPYLIMELVDGESLATVIAREAPISPDRVVGIIVSAASALAVAHAAGLVHRDVKPGNLLLGRDDSVKITDFGIARAADAVSLTRTGMLIGTPLYLAPEQTTGTPATAASDLYALGIIVYEMLTGEPPYKGPPAVVLLAHRDTPLPSLPPSIPPGLADLVHALTAKDPAMRPSTASAVAEWATRLRADPAIEAAIEAGGTNPHGRDTPSSAITRIDPPIPIPSEVHPGGVTRTLALPFGTASHRRPVVLLGGGLVLALIIGLVIGLTSSATSHRQPDPQHQSTTPATVSPSTAKKPIKRRQPDIPGTHGEHGHGHDGHGKGGRHGH